MICGLSVNSATSMSTAIPFLKKSPVHDAILLRGTSLPRCAQISLHDIHPHQELKINELTVIPLQVMHDKLPILGYKIGRLAYITDMKTIPEGEIDYLQDIDYLVVNALRFTKPHHSHMLVDEALEFARKTSAKQVFLTHMCHDIGLFDEAEQNFQKGYICLTTERW